MLDEREEVERGNAGGRPEGGRSPTGGLPPAGASEFLPARNNSGVLPTREPTGSGLETESRSTGRIYLSGMSSTKLLSYSQPNYFSQKAGQKCPVFHFINNFGENFRFGVSGGRPA